MQPALRPALLLVDDDPTLLAVLARRMAREGYEVLTASSGAQALQQLEQRWPSLLIVDLMMPGMDGFELCARVKRIADLPIIVLSAVDASEAKVRALEDYAEDYITKPFEPDELVARVQRVLRRSAGGHSQVVLDGGDLQIDLTGRRVTRPGGSFPLTPTEVRLLHVMIAQMDRTVATDTILNRVWSESDGADPSYVWVTIRRLRRKVEVDPDRPRFLLTERGVGYRLVSSTGSERAAAE
ncbi:MAG TPA: response regulator transcription factor [Methylomirabilota bacterium]|jgi:two-component system KDP operon response regulator KdpE|nr:response regulator transcription factor [Methylomirabilota bacterium]